jgi:hypothetical protein
LQVFEKVGNIYKDIILVKFQEHGFCKVKCFEIMENKSKYVIHQGIGKL